MACSCVSSSSGELDSLSLSISLRTKRLRGMPFAIKFHGDLPLCPCVSYITPDAQTGRKSIELTTSPGCRFLFSAPKGTWHTQMVLFGTKFAHYQNQNSDNYSPRVTTQQTQTLILYCDAKFPSVFTRALPANRPEKIFHPLSKSR